MTWWLVCNLRRPFFPWRPEERPVQYERSEWGYLARPLFTPRPEERPVPYERSESGYLAPLPFHPASRMSETNRDILGFGAFFVKRKREPPCRVIRIVKIAVPESALPFYQG